MLVVVYFNVKERATSEGRTTEDHTDRESNFDAHHAVAHTPSLLQSFRDAFRCGRLVWVFPRTLGDRVAIGTHMRLASSTTSAQLAKSASFRKDGGDDDRNMCMTPTNTEVDEALDRLHESDEEQVMTCSRTLGP